MNTLLYEPGFLSVLAPQFPFCYPPTAHRFADWVGDDWKEGPLPVKTGIPPTLEKGVGLVPVRQALVLIWKGEVLTDAYHRLYDAMSGVEKQEWRTADGWYIKYPNMADLDADQPLNFLQSMCIRTSIPDWCLAQGKEQARAWCLGRGAVKCLRGDLIEWEAP